MSSSTSSTSSTSSITSASTSAERLERLFLEIMPERVPLHVVVYGPGDAELCLFEQDALDEVEAAAEEGRSLSTCKIEVDKSQIKSVDFVMRTAELAA